MNNKEELIALTEKMKNISLRTLSCISPYFKLDSRNKPVYQKRCVSTERNIENERNWLIDDSYDLIKLYVEFRNFLEFCDVKSEKEENSLKLTLLRKIELKENEWESRLQSFVSQFKEYKKSLP